MQPLDPPAPLCSSSFEIEPIPEPPPPLALAPSAIVPEPPPPVPLDFWRSIWQGPTPARASQTVWLAAHGRATTQRLLHHIDPAVSGACLACDAADSVAHRFFECPLARGTWELLHTFIIETIKLSIPPASYTLLHILRGFPRLRPTLGRGNDAIRKLRTIRAITMDELENTRFYQRSSLRTHRVERHAQSPSPSRSLHLNHPADPSSATSHPTYLLSSFLFCAFEPYSTPSHPTPKPRRCSPRTKKGCHIPWGARCLSPAAYLRSGIEE